MELLQCLFMASEKIDKNIGGRLALLTSIVISFKKQEMKGSTHVLQWKWFRLSYFMK